MVFRVCLELLPSDHNESALGGKSRGICRRRSCSTRSGKKCFSARYEEPFLGLIVQVVPVSVLNSLTPSNTSASPATRQVMSGLWKRRRLTHCPEIGQIPPLGQVKCSFLSLLGINRLSSCMLAATYLFTFNVPRTSSSLNVEVRFHCEERKTPTRLVCWWLSSCTMEISKGDLIIHR